MNNSPRHRFRLIADIDRHDWSSQEFNSLANRLSRALSDAGLVTGDAIAVLAPNCGEYLALHQAALASGMYFVPVNWRLPISEVFRILRDSEAKALFVSRYVGKILGSILLADLPELRTRVVLESSDQRTYTTMERFIEGKADSPRISNTIGRVLAFTSATTGIAKAVLRPLIPNDQSRAKNLNQLHSSYTYRFDTPESGVHLCCSQFYHGPILEAAARELGKKSTIVIPTKWQPENTLRLIESYKVTSLFLVPMMFIRLLELPEAVRSSYDLSSLRVVWHSSAPCPQAVKRAMISWWGPIIWERYGSVEGPVSVISSEEWLRFPGSVGRPDQGVDIKILDNKSREVARGQTGLVYIRPHPEFEFEYKGDMKKTLAARHGDHYTIGDIGYLNSEGYLYLCDRQDNIINSGGINIYAAEIEQAMVQHPLVMDCAIISVPNSLLGEIPRALAVTSPNCISDEDLEEEILAFLRETLAAYQLPHGIQFVDSLPRDPNGKLYKRHIRYNS